MYALPIRKENAHGVMCDHFSASILIIKWSWRESCPTVLHIFIISLDISVYVKNVMNMKIQFILNGKQTRPFIFEYY